MQREFAFTLHLHTVSEANAHTHWRVRQARAKQHRSTAALFTRAMLAGSRPTFPIVVRLTRVAPRALDSDNVVGAMKHVRDGIADGLGVDDRDPRVTWTVDQRRGRAREYAVAVVVACPEQ